MTDSGKPVERRRFRRIPFSAEVRLSQTQTHWQTNLIDISFKGALTELPDDWEQADLTQPFSLEVIINEDISIKFTGTFRHEENGHLGFYCLNMDLDSASSLRRLVELNLGNPSLLERELSMLTSLD